MAVTGFLRGHKIYRDSDRDVWRYSDTDELTEGTHRSRDCGFCHKHAGEDGHDPCIANLPGVTNACCGHGNPEEAYVQLRSGSMLKGDEACEFFVANGKGDDD